MLTWLITALLTLHSVLTPGSQALKESEYMATTATNAFLNYFASVAPAKFADFLETINSFIHLNADGAVLHAPPTPTGPIDPTAPPTYTTTALSQSDLNDIRAHAADGIVNDKAIEFAKGFITGLTLAN